MALKISAYVAQVNAMKRDCWRFARGHFLLNKHVLCWAMIDILCLILCGLFLQDVLTIFQTIQSLQASDFFWAMLSRYITQMSLLYGSALVLFSILYASFQRLSPEENSIHAKIAWIRIYLFIFLVPLLSAWFPLYLNSALRPMVTLKSVYFMEEFIKKQALVYSVIEVFIVGWVCYHKLGSTQKQRYVIHGVGITLILSWAFVFYGEMAYYPASASPWMSFFSDRLIPLFSSKDFAIPYASVLLICMSCRTWLKKRERSGTSGAATHQSFGSAQWATPLDHRRFHRYDKTQGILSGVDAQGKSIYLPLMNKLILSPPGGGKTSCSSIPALLSHEGAAFVFDIKGELWAVTARHRAQAFNRKIVVLDPFQVRAQPDFCEGKAPHLLEYATINPFDFIPEDPAKRDRMINALACAFVVRENNTGIHFDENAKILIRGYIDYLMHLPAKARTLNHLYTLMSENLEDSQLTFEHMRAFTGRASAAASQISRVGMDERGSILSTSYRQIDWLSDRNIQATFETSNFELRDFLKGEMDLYIILPEDQVKEQSRLIRIILSLLMSEIIQTNPADLPPQKMLFLLDELAQLGYCPDVEQCIEILRARGVIVWSVFQTLSQIELFKKPDLFKGAPIKQIFTLDDVKTMEWIQKLGGKKTIVTKNKSQSTGDSRQKSRWWGGQTSTGASESLQETGTDLIPINEIRELSLSEQFIFLQGQKPIRCQKRRYFEAPEFAGCWDRNPLEFKSTL